MAASPGDVPHFTYVQELNNKWNFGFSVNVPVRPEDRIWQRLGRTLFRHRRRKSPSVNLNPTLSFKVNDHVSIGFGVSACMYANLIILEQRD